MYTAIRSNIDTLTARATTTGDRAVTRTPAHRLVMAAGQPIQLDAAAGQPQFKPTEGAAWTGIPTASEMRATQRLNGVSTLAAALATLTANDVTTARRVYGKPSEMFTVPEDHELVVMAGQVN